MEKRAWGTTVAKIIAALEECGEMTPDEICKHINVERDNVSTIMTRISKPGKVAPQRVYIVRYVDDAEGMRRYPRPVYALGDKQSAKRPKSDLKEIRRRYRAKQRKFMTSNSVFNLGMTRRKYEEQRRSA